MSAPATASVSVDSSLCASTGVCESVAPDLFEIGDDGELVLLSPQVSDGDVERAAAAARACPTRALRVG